MTSARLRSLLRQPAHRGFPSRTEPLRPRPGGSWAEQLGKVDAESFGNGVQAHERRARGVAALQSGEGAYADTRSVGQALLARASHAATIPQVVAESSEQLRVPHGDSRRLPAIVFQATRCLYWYRARSSREALVICRSRCSMFVVGALALATACADKAQPDYAKCVQAQAVGKIGDALDACKAAISADPNSTSGKAAAAKLAEMRHKFEVEAAEAQAELDSLKTDVTTLRRQVKASGTSETDSECQAQGKPPYRNSYGGGTYDENEQVALADGCKHLFPFRGSHSPNDNEFCCPH